MCSVKKVFVETSQNSQENTCAKVSFFNKVACLRPASGGCFSILNEASLNSHNKNSPCKYYFVKFYGTIHNNPKINAYFFEPFKSDVINHFSFKEAVA